MRTTFFCFLFITVFFTQFSFAQQPYFFTETIKTPEQLRKGAVENYFYDIQESEKLFNDKMLNIFFASEVGTYLNDSKDLSLQKAYFVISTADKTLFIGRTFDFRDDKLKKLSHILTIGAKADLKDDFSTIFKNGDAQNNIGFNFKYNYIGRGIINYGSHQDEVTNYRNNILKEKYKKEITKYLKDDGDYNAVLANYKALYGENSKLYNKKTDSIISDKAKEIYGQIAEDEIKIIRTEKLYNFLWDHWWTFEAFVPVTEKSYNIISDINTTDYKSEKFYAWKLLAGYTSFWKFSNGKAFYLTGLGSVFNNNNAEISSLDKFDLPILNQTNPSLVKDNKTVYVGDFENFTTTNLMLEAVSYLFLDGTIGLSASIEKNFGDYDVENWKLGIPFSLKDSEGKPTVNFELQWKEINKKHFVGVGVGYAFGKFIK